MSQEEKSYDLLHHCPEYLKLLDRIAQHTDESTGLVDIDRLRLNEGESDLEIGEWGSCQYWTAYCMFRLLRDIERILEQENKFRKDMAKKHLLPTIPDVLANTVDSHVNLIDTDPVSFLGLNVQWEEKTPVDQIVRECVGERIAKYIEWDLSDDSVYYVDDVKRLKANPPKTIEGLFAMERESASDLWSAAPMIARKIFKNFSAKGLPGPKYDPKKHVLLNISCWDQNNMVGLYCYLLCKHGYVAWENHQDVYGGFDT